MRLPRSRGSAWAEVLGTKGSSRENTFATCCEEPEKMTLGVEAKGGTLLRSLSFKQWEGEEAIGTMDCNIRPSCINIEEQKSLDLILALCPQVSPRPKCELDAAAIKLQKVYKSYRTRRNLADCAVVVEELWWKALDFASLKHSSISFFNGEKPETAASRWARARTRAAKVGKGLSKNGKAQQLALQHWLEAIDPRHRYGHNLHLYYDVWFKSESTEPFFYWLDIGKGKEINLEKCPRSKLQSQCIKYLGPKEREEYEVVVRGGKLVYKLSGILVNTLDDSKWIFVLSTTKAFYVGQKKKGSFQHSSFLAGGAITSAGRLVVKDGILKAIWPYSGHYLPTEENFREFIRYLQENNVDLTDIKTSPIDRDDEYPMLDKPVTQSITAMSGGSDGTKPTENARTVADEQWSEPEADDTPTMLNETDIEADRTVDNENMSETEADDTVMESHNTDDEEMGNSEKSASVDHINNHLTRTWSSGAGPRIRCVRDYPSDLQSKALEHVNLSPRVTTSPPSRKRDPVPSPRPSPGIILSPRLASVGFQPRPVSLKLPDLKRSRLH